MTVVAVDGPSGSGKSSAARGVARRLGMRHLDTGAMYRAVTWWLQREQVDIADAEAVAVAVKARPSIEVGTDPDQPWITIDGVDVTGPIRTREVTAAVSPVSAVPAVRHWVVELQRELIALATSGIVVEGRDIGTVVAPHAEVKVFLTADAAERVRRRVAEFSVGPTGAAGATTVQATEEELAMRDRLDSTRVTSPLRPADDAVVLDSTALDLAQVIDRICALVER